MQFKTKIHKRWLRYMVHERSCHRKCTCKLNWGCLGLGWASFVTLELFRFESGLFGLMMDKTSVIDVI